MFFFLSKKEPKTQERSDRPLPVLAMLRGLSFRPPLLSSLTAQTYNQYRMLLFTLAECVGVDERCELQVLGKQRRWHCAQTKT